MLVVIGKKSNKLYFSFDNNSYKVVFSNFVFQKKIVKIYRNSRFFGFVKSVEKKYKTGFNRSYLIDFFNKQYIVGGNKDNWELESDLGKFYVKFNNNRDYDVFFNSIKIAKLNYDLTFNKKRVLLKLGDNEHHLFEEVMAIFLSISCDRYLRSFVGDAFDIKT